MWCISLTDLWMLKNPCITGTKSTWLRCMIFLLFCCIWFARILLIFLHLCLLVLLDCSFFLWPLCLVWVLGCTVEFLCWYWCLYECPHSPQSLSPPAQLKLGAASGWLRMILKDQGKKWKGIQKRQNVVPSDCISHIAGHRHFQLLKHLFPVCVVSLCPAWVRFHACASVAHVCLCVCLFLTYYRCWHKGSGTWDLEQREEEVQDIHRQARLVNIFQQYSCPRLEIGQNGNDNNSG